MATLTANPQMVVLQFSFSNPSLVPVCIQRLEAETPEQSDGRKVNINGRQTIDATENCSIKNILGQIEKAGFTMVSAQHQKRINPNPKVPWKNTYVMVRFIFVPKASVNEENQHPTFKLWKDKIQATLEELTTANHWRTRCFYNPFVKNGEIVPDQEMVSINFEARVPLFSPDGKPVLARRKVNGVAESPPVPLAPSFTLNLADGEFCLIPC